MDKKALTNRVVLISMMIVIAALFIQFYSNNKRSENRGAAHSIEVAKANFLAQLPDSNARIDSVYSRGDTISFYSKDTLLGMSITTTIE
jgi:hypothetical protein